MPTIFPMITSFLAKLRKKNSALLITKPIEGAVQAALQKLENDAGLADRTTLTPVQIADLLNFVLRSTYFQSRRDQTSPLMFHEGYICLVYIFLNQVWQMSFLCSPVYFNFEVVTKCQIITS